MKARIVRIDKTLPLPEYKTEGAVAFDLYTREKMDIPSKTIAYAPSNIIVEVAPGYVLMVAARSGLHKKGLSLANGVGIIDQDFHGPEDEIKIALYNFSDAMVSVEKGDRLAQAMFVPVEKGSWEEVVQIKEVSRSGFGSTGMQ
ncbi:MAG: dUTP diphosphatase [Patescibacteria group bacterium]